MLRKIKIHKRIMSVLLAVLITICSLSVCSIDAEAHDAYFLGVAFDSDSCRYIGTVSFQSNSMIGDNHAEAEITCDFHKVYEGSGIPIIDYDNIPSDMEAEYSSYRKDSSFDNDKELLFSFPGFHTKGVSTYKLNANGSDELLAERINNTVLGGLNSAIDFIVEQAGTSRTNSKEIRSLAAKLANAVRSNGQSGSNSVSWSTSEGIISIGLSYNNSRLPDSANIEEKDIPLGFEPEDYVEITVNGKSACFAYQAWKGYQYPNYDPNSNNNKVDQEVDPYARDITGNDWYKDVGKNGVQKLGWDALVLQAHYNKDVCGVEFSNLGNILPTNALVSAIAGLCDNVITGIRSFLGLYALDELMLNKGTRGLSYSMGLFPNGWVGPILMMFIICLMLAWGVMGFAVIKIFMKRSLATINVGEKMNIMNELKNLAVCCFMLGAFPLIFNMLARINYSLVALFGSSTEFTNAIKNFYTLSQANFGSIIACFMGLALQLYFNFFYILRAITIAILYGIAPLAIYTIVLGGKNAKVFSAWSKELLSNIFVQSIHALMIAFFTSVSALSGLKTFESIVVLYSFIPLTKFVKQNVFQASDGIGGMAAGLSDMAKDGAKATYEAATGGGGNSSSGGAGTQKEAGSSYTSGGTGGVGGASTGILADRMAQSKTPGQRNVMNSFSDNADVNVTGKLGQKAANWIDREHSTKVGGVVAGAANSIRNTADSARGYGAGTTGITALDKDDSSFQDSNGKMRSLGNTETGGKVALGRTVGVAKGLLKAGANFTLAGAEMGMALGSSAYGGKGADRMFREAGTRLGNSVGTFKNTVGIATNKNDKQHLQHMKNNGIKSMDEDSKYLYKTMDVKYDKEKKKLTGDGLENMSDAQKTTLLNHCKSVDDGSNQSKQERAFYQTQMARMGEHIGLTGDGTIVMKYDKAIMNQNRATDYVTYGSAMSEYHEAPKTAVQELAEQKAQAEIHDMNHTNFEGKDYHMENGMFVQSGGQQSSPTSSDHVPMSSEAESADNYVPMPSEAGVPSYEKPTPQQSSQIVDGNGKPITSNPAENPRPIKDEELRTSASQQQSVQSEPRQESPQVRQAIQEEEDFLDNPYPNSQELQDLIMNINNPGMYGNPNPSDFPKGTNPRSKK